MANMIEVEGVKDIISEMKTADRKIAHGTRRGITNAALFVQRKSQKIVPIKTSTLKNSAGTRVLGHGWFSEAIVYYTASYAVYVHERLDLRHKRGKSAKFLEKPIRQYHGEILKLIAGSIQIEDIG